MRHFVFIGALLCASSATASELPLDLVWSAPAACPTETALSERVRALTKSSPSLNTSERVTAHGTIAPVEGGFSLQLAVSHQGKSSTRTLAAQSCEELTDAAALMVSLALQPPPTVKETPEEPPSPSRSKSPSTLWLAATGLIDWGPLPLAQGRMQIEAAYLQGPVRLQIHLGTGFTQTVTGTPRADAGATVHMPFSGGASACAVPWRQSWEFDACLGVEAGLLTAAGLELNRPATGSGLWLSPVANLGLGYFILPWLGVRGEVTGGLATSRPQVVIDTSGPIFQSSLLFGRASLGLWVRIF